MRFWQLGIEMRPFFVKSSLYGYPIYAGLGASFGYWLQGIEDRQVRVLAESRNRLLEKRARRAEREGGSEEGNVGSLGQRNQEGLFASPQRASM